MWSNCQYCNAYVNEDEWCHVCNACEYCCDCYPLPLEYTIHLFNVTTTKDLLVFKNSALKAASYAVSLPQLKKIKGQKSFSYTGLTLDEAIDITKEIYRRAPDLNVGIIPRYFHER
jgi:hypothetical protein